ncbi:MAG TPA: histidinol dehydrogenase, partial [Halioglobus sp.]
MRRLDTSSADFDRSLRQLTTWEGESDTGVNQAVAAIIADILTRGDVALLEYTARFDHLRVESVAQLEISRERQVAALHRIE